MKSSSIRLCLLVLLLLATSCVGPDPVRLQSERANLALARRCAEGWFNGLPFTPFDVSLVNSAFTDWEKALDADAKLLVVEVKQ